MFSTCAVCSPDGFHRDLLCDGLGLGLAVLFRSRERDLTVWGVGRETVEQSDLVKEREAAKQAVLAKVLAGPKISETPEFKAQQAAKVTSMEEDLSSRQKRGKAAGGTADTMEVDGGDASLKVKKGGVGKRKGGKGKPAGRVKQGAEKFEKLGKVGLFQGVSPIVFTRLHKKYKKGRKPGIREQMGIE